MTVDLEPIRNVLESRLRVFYNQIEEVQSVTASEVLRNGELSKEGHDYYLDECMFQVTWLGEQYEIACEDADIDLPDDFISDMEKRLLNQSSEVLQQIITMYGGDSQRATDMI